MFSEKLQIRLPEGVGGAGGGEDGVRVRAEWEGGQGGIHSHLGTAQNALTTR